MRWKYYSEISRLIQCDQKDFWKGRQKDEIREGDMTMEQVREMQSCEAGHAGSL